MKIKIFFLLFLLSFLAALLTEHSDPGGDRLSGKDVNTLFREKLERKFIRQRDILADTGLERMVSAFDLQDPIFRKLRNSNLSLFAYRNKCLVFWSDNTTQPYNFPSGSSTDRLILHNSNGWHQVATLQNGPYEYYCFYRFYREYPLNNEFFTNSFSPDLRLYDLQAGIRPSSLSGQYGSYRVYKDLPLLDSRQFSEIRQSRSVELLYLLSVVLFIVFAAMNSGTKGVFSTRKFIIHLCVFGAAFNLMAFADLIMVHKSINRLFSPELSAFSDFIPSLGHSILFSVFILCSLVLIHQVITAYRNDLRVTGQVAFAAASLVLWGILTVVILWLLPVYVLNSRVNFDFKFLTNVNEYTLIGMFNVFLFFLFILLANRIVASLIGHRFERRAFLFIHLLIGLVVISLAYFIRKENGFLLICFALYGIMLPFWVFFITRISFRHIMALALMTAAIFSVQFEQLNSHKEQENRKLYANRLIAKEDIDLELKLRDVENQMVRSSAIDSFFYYDRPDYTELEISYIYDYFNDISRNYDVSLMRYDSMGQDITPNKMTYSYVNSLYNRSTNKSISNYFLFIEDLHYLGAYLAKFEICPGERNIGYVFLLLSPKLKSDHQNLDYFFSRTDFHTLADERYSYAIYQSGELVKGLGSFPYKLNDHERYAGMDDETFLTVNGYSQLLKKIASDTYLFVSLRSPTMNQVFTVFTFILLYFTVVLISAFMLIYLIILLLSSFSSKPFFRRLHDIVTSYLRILNINKLYLETKIRISFLMMSVLICSVVVYFTIQNVNKSFREKQNETIDKKMSRIVSELEFGYTKKDERPLQNLIKHLSNTNEVDINLYLRDGTLYQTANSRIFNEGWFSAYIHPAAYFELIQRRQYNFKQFERVGSLEYQSYYNAIFDESRNLLGYVHVPYFSKSIDLKNEFSVYLGSLLNMSTLLLMISLLIASYIGRSLVRPLNLMIESLARIKLGAHNREISWHRNDEIGQLVEQYNSMLRKLEDSTEKLARSEREGAWKEMAKQVAHEIKNPLTPMKLHLQHLQMSLNRNDENLKEKINSISQMLIEQIDQLSRMAEEFSNFAKMPMAVPQPCNLHLLLQTAINLFRSQNDLEIEYQESSDILPVYVDKDQMIRVLTNVFKNALQAARENVKCRIVVKVSSDGDTAEISIADNGKGIEDGLKDRIFQPNFSTKNSGMGLGLAICKKIMEQLNGDITFSSELNKGTTFYVRLPVYKGPA